MLLFFDKKFFIASFQENKKKLIPAGMDPVNRSSKKS